MDDSAGEAAPAPVPPPPATRNPLKRLYRWVLSWANHKHGTTALFALAVAESVIFPIPPDVLMIALILGRREKAAWYAAVCTVGSLIGAALGYAVGRMFWEATQEFWYRTVIDAETFAQITGAYNEHGALFVFSAAFTFIPFKVFTLGAGVAEQDFLVFMGASLAGRSGRFFLVAALFWWLGPRIAPFIEKWFNWLALLFVILLIAGFWALSLLKKDDPGPPTPDRPPGEQSEGGAALGTACGVVRLAPFTGVAVFVQKVSEQKADAAEQAQEAPAETPPLRPGVEPQPREEEHRPQKTDEHPRCAAEQPPGRELEDKSDEGNEEAQMTHPVQAAAQVPPLRGERRGGRVQV